MWEGTLTVEPTSNGYVLLTISSVGDNATFWLDPKDSGDLAAAIFQCSPSRNEGAVMITPGGPTEKGQHAELGIKEDSREDGTDYGQSCREETKGDSAGQETTNTGNIQDSCTDRGSEKGSPQGS